MKFSTVEAYFGSLSDEQREALTEVRNVVLEAIPKATELISYNMPAYKFKKMLVYYAAYANHIGFYPTSSGIEAFKHELSSYKHAKGSVQFPYDQPLPVDLITRIARFRFEEEVNQTT